MTAMNLSVVAALLAATLPLAGLSAQEQPPPARYFATLAAARQAAAYEAWPDAARLYRELTEANPTNGALWLELGQALRQTGALDASARALVEAFRLGVGFTRPYLAREIANLYAALDRREDAIAWLERALASRFQNRAAFQEDETVRRFGDDPRVQRLAGVLPAHVTDRDAGWRYDLRFLVAEARRLHKDVDRPAYSPAFEALARSIHDRIPELSDAEIVLELRRLIVLLNDGHTHLEAGPGATRLPLHLYRFDDGLFIIDAAPEYRRHVGSRIVRFADFAADDAFAAVAPWVPRDNDMGLLWWGPRTIVEAGILAAIGATSDTTAVRLTLEDRTGATHDVVVTPSADWRTNWSLVAPSASGSDSVAMFLRHLERNYWLTPLPGADAVYFQFNRVLVDAAEPIPAFAARLQRTLGETGATNLVVDLRHNSGGNSYTFAPLVRVLAFFQQASPNHRIYVLIGRNTFSAAQNFTNIVATLTDAIFVGEPTGSSATFVGESGGMILPYSRLRPNVSFRTHQGTIWDEDRVWIAPDVPAGLTSGQYFAHEDPGMDAVLALIRQGRSGVQP